MRRVVVTGIGLVTPLGCGVDVVWRRLIEGQSGHPPDRSVRRSTTCRPRSRARCRARGRGRFQIDDGRGAQGCAQERSVHHLRACGRDRRGAGRRLAARGRGCARQRTGVLIGSGIGGLSTIADTAIELERRGPRRVSPFFIPASLINLVSGQVSIRFGFKGPNHSVVTACSTGAHAHRRREPADRARRCRRHGRRRRRGRDLPPGRRGLRRRAGALDPLQR